MNFVQELWHEPLIIGNCFFFYLEEGLDGRHMAGTFSSAVLIHIITNLFNVDRRDYVWSE